MSVRMPPRPKHESGSIESNKSELFSTPTLSAHPTEAEFSVSYSVNLLKRQKAKDKKSEQQFEFVDHDEPNCHVDVFKKVSFNQPETRLNCFVTSFPFSGHSSTDAEDKEVMPPIQSKLVNPETILTELAASTTESPFVFLMNQLKYKSMAVEDHMEISPGFSMFNRDTEHPFEPVPNVFLLSPPDIGQ